YVDHATAAAEIYTLSLHDALPIWFTPDEEIGRGAHKFDVKKFGADWAYTMDGSQVGELEYENFNAAGAVVTVKGKMVHPGSAKGDRKSTRLNSSHVKISYAVFCLK